MVAFTFSFYAFALGFNCFFLASKSLFFFKTFRGLFILKMPSFFFSKTLVPNGISFCFAHKHFFMVFVRYLMFCSGVLFFILRLKVRGLGYRIKAMSQFFFRFFIGTCNWYFFHAPSRLLVRVRRRRMLLLSFDKALIYLVFSHLILLKKIIPYKLRGAFFPKQVILMKPGKKSF